MLSSTRTYIIYTLTRLEQIASNCESEKGMLVMSPCINVTFFKVAVFSMALLNMPSLNSRPVTLPAYSLKATV